MQSFFKQLRNLQSVHCTTAIHCKLNLYNGSFGVTFIRKCYSRSYTNIYSVFHPSIQLLDDSREYHVHCPTLQVLSTMIYIQGCSWVFVAGGSRQSRRRSAENSTAEGTLGTPHKFSHRICTNLRGPPDRPWGVRTPGPPRPATPLSISAASMPVKTVRIQTTRKPKWR
jgi:hypothetical protein